MIIEGLKLKQFLKGTTEATYMYNFIPHLQARTHVFTNGSPPRSRACVCVVIYTPVLQKGFFTGNLGGLFWLPSLLFLAIVLPMTEAIKWSARRHPDGFVARTLAW